MPAENNRHAYLDAMGIDLWTRRVAVLPPDAAVSEASQTTEAPDWEQLRKLVAGCTRCAPYGGCHDG